MASPRGVRRRTLATGLLSLIIAGGLATPSSADELVCVMVTYQKFNGPIHTVIDECYVPTSWNHIGVGPICQGPPQIVRTCEGVRVALPV